jgi:hypothetical protein
MGVSPDGEQVFHASIGRVHTPVDRTGAAADREICTLVRFSTLMGASVQISRDQSVISASRVFSACSTRSA